MLSHGILCLAANTILGRVMTIVLFSGNWFVDCRGLCFMHINECLSPPLEWQIMNVRIALSIVVAHKLGSDHLARQQMWRETVGFAPSVAFPSISSVCRIGMPRGSRGNFALLDNWHGCFPETRPQHSSGYPSVWLQLRFHVIAPSDVLEFFLVVSHALDVGMHRSDQRASLFIFLDKVLRVHLLCLDHVWYLLL